MLERERERVARGGSTSGERRTGDRHRRQRLAARGRPRRGDAHRGAARRDRAGAKWRSSTWTASRSTVSWCPRPSWPSPRRVPALRGGRGGPHARPVCHRGGVRGRRAAGRPLPDACARRGGAGRTVRDVRHAGAGRGHARGAREPQRRADGQPRRDRLRPRPRRGHASSPSCSNGRAAVLARGVDRHAADAGRLGPAGVHRGGHPRAATGSHGGAGHEDRHARSARGRRAGASGRADPRGAGRSARRTDPDHPGRPGRRHRGDPGQARARA